MIRNNRLSSLPFALLPVAIWVFVILYYSYNVPWYDDFDPFPDFLQKWITEPDLSKKLTLLFQPNNEHRMVIGKLMTLVYYWFTGHLNFTFLHIIAGCFTLGTLTIFWSAFKSSKLNPWYFLPVPILLFQLQYHLIFLWAICGLQHQPAVFFVCLSMFFLARKHFAGGILAGILASFSMSSGLFVWPAGIVVLLFTSRYKHLAVWTLVAALSMGTYFMGMSPQGNESSIEFLLQNPHLSVLGFFAALGGLFDFLPQKTIEFRSSLPVLMGFVVVVWVAIWLWKVLMNWLQLTFNWPARKVTVENPSQVGNSELSTFLLGILTFLLVNALVICILRPRFGFFVMIVSNYKLYPALFLSAAYLSLISSIKQEFRREKAFRWAVIVSIGIWGLSAYGYLPVISERRKYYVANGYNQEHNAFGLGHVPFSKSAAYVDTLMKKMVSAGIYQYPVEGNELAAKVKTLSTPLNDGQITVTQRDSSVMLSSQRGSISLSRTNTEYAFVRNAEHLYFFKMEPQRYVGRNFLRQYDKGSAVEINYNAMSPGTYDLGIADVDGDEISGGILGKITIP